MSLDWKSSYAALHARGEADFPPACLHTVADLTRQFFRAQGNKHVSPAELAEAFQRQTRHDFGPWAGEVLSDWGIYAPRDFGRAVMRLGQQGCLDLGENDVHECLALSSSPFTHA